MNTTAVMQATLKPDGTLELDQKPNLPPGRVQVIVENLPPRSSARRVALMEARERSDVDCR